MSAIRFSAVDLPDGATLEVWGDGTVWIVYNRGLTRTLLRHWAENERNRCGTEG